MADECAGRIDTTAQPLPVAIKPVSALTQQLRLQKVAETTDNTSPQNIHDHIDVRLLQEKIALVQLSQEKQASDSEPENEVDEIETLARGMDDESKKDLILKLVREKDELIRRLTEENSKLKHSASTSPASSFAFERREYTENGHPAKPSEYVDLSLKFTVRNLDTGEIFDSRRPEIHSVLANVTPPPKRLRSDSKPWVEWWNAKREHNKLLWDAAERGDAPLVARLLETSSNNDIAPNVNSQSLNAWTALHLAAHEGHANVIETLLVNGAKLDAVTTSQRTALHIASMRGHLSVAELLVHAGADVNCQDEAKDTPCHCASECGHVSVVRFLLLQNCDIQLKNNLGKTPADVAMNIETQELFRLNGKNGKTNEEKYGRTPFARVLIHNARTDVVKRLLYKVTHNVTPPTASPTVSPAVQTKPLKETVEEKRRNSESSAIAAVAAKRRSSAPAEKRRALSHSQPQQSNIPIVGKRGVSHSPPPLHNIAEAFSTNSVSSDSSDSSISSVDDCGSGNRTGLKGGANHSCSKRGGGLFSQEKVGPDHFVVLKMLGKGSFGEVYQVEKKDNGSIYAMKVLHKNKIMGRNLVRYAMTERNVLSYIRHPFIVGLNFAFQTSDKLFLLLDFCPGGDLGQHLSRERRFSEDRARFYTAAVLLALEHLHKLNIIYRDLKPDNVVLDAEGYACLTDFGLSKEGVFDNVSASSFCGSVAYLAPEMLKRSGHGKSVDWYLLGVMLFEMLTGAPPFFCNNRDQLFFNIEKGTLKFPTYLSRDARSLLKGLLERDPSRRLGAGPQDAEEIKSHPFFQTVSWHAMMSRHLRPPSVAALVRSPGADAPPLVDPLVDPLPKVPGVVSDRHLSGWSFENPSPLAAVEDDGI
eukprot:GILJ01003723.1.p1 GENE.GILJ01003723.1~~GILJ01003723.1.p1  ORF type:complete len:872 (-),score=124.93 GILJ01003723.1:436-3051(-)